MRVRKGVTISKIWPAQGGNQRKFTDWGQAFIYEKTIMQWILNIKPDNFNYENRY